MTHSNGRQKNVTKKKKNKKNKALICSLLDTYVAARRRSKSPRSVLLNTDVEKRTFRSGEDAVRCRRVNRESGWQSQRPGRREPHTDHLHGRRQVHTVEGRHKQQRGEGSVTGTSRMKVSGQLVLLLKRHYGKDSALRLWTLDFINDVITGAPILGFEG